MQLNDNTTLQGGKYRITRFIGQGGFGITYEGVHVLMGHRVAIKEFFVGNFCQRDSQGTVNSTQVSAQLVEKLRSKFITEARILHQLNHSGIVKVHDVFEENGTAYYVMDYIDGESLDSIIKRNGGRLSEDIVCRYLNDVADALSYLHSHNRLHLDLKPANIMIDRNTGRAKLIDFGVSKQYDEVNGQNTSTLIGKTPGYAPIEQLNSDVQKFTPATDIYALAATLYKALTGNVPPSPSAILEDGLPPLPASVSAPMQRIITRGLKLKRTDRYPSIAAMMTDLNGSDAPSDEATTIDTAPTITPIEIPVDNAKKQKSNAKYIWIALVCLVVIGIGVFCFFPGKNGNSKKSVEDSELLSSEVSNAEVFDTVFDPYKITQEDLDKFANVKYPKFDYYIGRKVTDLYINDGDADSIYNLKLYLANKGYSDMLVTFANWYDYGTGPGHYKEQNLDKAIYWYKRAAELEDVESANRLGQIYEYLDLPDEANKYYRMAKDSYYKNLTGDYGVGEYRPPHALSVWSTPPISSVEEGIQRTNPRTKNGATF